MSNPQSTFPLSQYLSVTASQSYSPSGDFDSQACPSNSGSDSTWWDDFVNFSDDDYPPEGSVSSGSVAEAISDETNSGIDFKMTASQLTSSSNESIPTSPPDINKMPSIPIDISRPPEIMDSSNNSLTQVPTAISNTQEHWNYVESSSSSSPLSNSDYDSRDDMGRERSSSSISISNESFFSSPDSCENYKLLIPKCSLFTCPHCHTSCSSESRLRYHSRKCSKRTQHQCPACSKILSTEKDLQRHKRTSCKNLPREIFACQCGKSYFRNDNLKRHIDVSNNKGEEETRQRHQRQQHKAV